MTSEELEKYLRDKLPVSPAGFLRECNVAEALDLAGRTLRLWRKDGKGPPWHKLNGGIFYHVTDIVAFIIARRRT